MLNQIPARLLLPLDGLKERFEIPRPETREVVALNNLDEDSGPVHQVLLLLGLCPLLCMISRPTYLGEEL